MQSKANKSNVIKLPDTKARAKPKKKKRRSKKRINSILLGTNAHDTSKVTSLALKFYSEQMLDSSDPKREKYTNTCVKLSKATKEERKSLEFEKQDSLRKQFDRRCVEHLKQIVNSIPAEQLAIVAIIHNADKKRDPDDMFDISEKKSHFHLLAWSPDANKNGSLNYAKKGAGYFRVHSLVVNKLGLHYTSDDTKIWDNRGAETISDIPSYLMYLTHESSSAIEKHKHIYDYTKLITNLPISTIQELRNRYHEGIADHKKKKFTDTELDNLAEDAYQLGLHCGDFDKWADDHFHIRQQAYAYFHKIHERYLKGLAIGIGRAPFLTRISVLITGAGNIGKTYNTNRALCALDRSPYMAPRGSGKYDGVTYDTRAMVFDDVYPSDALSVFDNRVSSLHRRNNGDRLWRGDFAVATTNLNVDEWLAYCVGISSSDIRRDLQGNLIFSVEQKRSIDALKSRMYICHVECGDDGHYRLVVDSAQWRGNDASKEAHDKKFKQFQEAFNNSIYSYQNHETIEQRAYAETMKKINAGCPHMTAAEYLNSDKYISGDATCQGILRALSEHEFNENEKALRYQEMS